ncbi:hypothetical protein ACI8AA_01500 [Geodermatophilus sp. SYSU D01180]
MGGNRGDAKPLGAADQWPERSDEVRWEPSRLTGSKEVLVETLPEEAAARLREDIQAHGRRIEELRRLMEVAADEIAIHEAVLELAQDDRIISATGEIQGADADLRDGLVTDLARYFTATGTALPSGVTFSPGDPRSQSLRLHAEIRRGGAVMEITWGPDIGFVGHGLVPQLSFVINAPSEGARRSS